MIVVIEAVASSTKEIRARLGFSWRALETTMAPRNRDFERLTTNVLHYNYFNSLFRLCVCDSAPAFRDIWEGNVRDARRNCRGSRVARARVCPFVRSLNNTLDSQAPSHR